MSGVPVVPGTLAVAVASGITTAFLRELAVFGPSRAARAVEVYCPNQDRTYEAERDIESEAPTPVASHRRFLDEAVHSEGWEVEFGIAGGGVAVVQTLWCLLSGCRCLCRRANGWCRSSARRPGGGVLRIAARRSVEAGAGRSRPVR